MTIQVHTQVDEESQCPRNSEHVGREGQGSWASWGRRAKARGMGVLGEGPRSGMAGVPGWIQWLMSQKSPPIPLELKGHDALGTECPVVEVWSFPGGWLDTT